MAGLSLKSFFLPSVTSSEPSLAFCYRILWGTWGITVLMGAVALVWAHFAGFKFPVMPLMYLFIPSAVLLLAATAFHSLRNSRHGKHIAIFLHYIVLMAATTIFVEMLCYLGTWLNLPLMDETLIAMDAALGFNWLEYVTWLGQHPVIMRILSISYQSLIYQFTLLIIALVLVKRVAQMQRFFISSIIALIITVILATLWPAVGGYVFYNVDPAQLGLDVAAARKHELDYLALRSGELMEFPDVMKGLITFPSFHATSAILLLWAAFALKHPALRGFFIILNILMVISVLADGGHYLMDLIGGVLVALISIRVSYLIIGKIRI